MCGHGFRLGPLAGNAHVCAMAFGAVMLAVSAFLVCEPAVAFAVSSANGAVDDTDAVGGESAGLATQSEADFYAVLHGDGELVFQREAPANDADAPGIKAIYEGSLSGYSNDAKASWLESARLIKSVRFASDFAALQPQSLAFWFSGCANMTSIDLTNLDASESTTMKQMFEGCESLSTVKLGPGFTFNGSSADRQCQLPDGNWKSSTTGEVFASDEVPNCVAATYTKVKAAGADNEKDGENGEGAELADDSSKGAQPDGGSGASTSKDAKPEKSDSAETGLAVGKTCKAAGATYIVLANGPKPIVVFQKAPKAKMKVIVPASVLLNGKRYAVAGISAGAFKGTAAKTLVVKTQALTKKRVKGCFKGAAKLKTVKVPSAYAKVYAGFFDKANSGKRVAVL